MKKIQTLSSVMSTLILVLVSAPRGSSQTPDMTPQEPTNAYPPEIVQIYLENCVGDRPEEIRAFCTCTIEKIQETYTLDEFIEIGQELQDGQPEPEEFRQIITSCVPN
ncbi:hypothetical protein [Coleofasciculus sp. G2-EDA-02]|uniref:hypothetical protein n=1 Tax=Coleofasciculus sp. G2-EDA-02 TaxID=3069529 RepID=UPI0032FF5E9A